MERAVIAKDKRAGYSIRFAAYVLDEDEYGTWLWTPAGSTARYFEGEDVLLQEWPNFLSLAQSDEWFWAGWWVPDRGPTIGTDACTPPTLRDATWSWTDLELDVVRDHTGAVWVEDQDEFEHGITSGHIARDEEREARAITVELEHRLRERVPPFDTTGWRRHDSALALDFPPLEEAGAKRALNSSLDRTGSGAACAITVKASFVISDARSTASILVMTSSG